MKHFPGYWPCVRESTGHRWIPPQSQSRGALMFSLISAWTNGWANNFKAGDLRHYQAHYDVTIIARLFKSDGRTTERWHQPLRDPVPKLMYIFEHAHTNYSRVWCIKNLSLLYKNGGFFISLPYQLSNCLLMEDMLCTSIFHSNKYSFFCVQCCLTSNFKWITMFPVT